MRPRILGQINKQTLLILTISGFLAVALAVRFNLADEQLTKPVVVALFGISASVALAILLEQLDINHFVEQWGCFSLEIYVAHTISSAILRIVLQKFCGFAEPRAHLVLETGVGIYGPIALGMICRRIGLRYMFTLRSF